MKAKGIFLTVLLSLALAVPGSSRAADGDFKWQFNIQLGSASNCSPAIAEDGTIYVNVLSPSWNYQFFALNPVNGHFIWRRFADWNNFSAAVAKDGTIYHGSGNSLLYIWPDGGMTWTYETGGLISTIPAIARDGTVYVGSQDHCLYALNPHLSFKWKYETGYWISSGPAIGPDGTIYFGSGDYNFYALHPDGSLKWQHLTGDWVTSSPAIGKDGTIYVGCIDDSMNSHLAALRPDGSVKWTAPTAGGMVGSPAIGPDGTIYLGAIGLYAINPDGSQKWRWHDPDNPVAVQGCPAVGKDGTIYILTSPAIDGTVYGALTALNPANASTRWERLFNGDMGSGSPALAPDGTIYFGCGNGNIYAYETSCGGLAESPWPMIHRDPQHRGQAPPYSLTPISLLLMEE